MQDLSKDWKGGSGSLFSYMPDSPDFTGIQDGGEDNNTVNFEFVSRLIAIRSSQDRSRGHATWRLKRTGN